MTLRPPQVRTWIRPNTSTISVTTLPGRMYWVERWDGALAEALPADTVWQRDHLLAEARQLGWRLERTEPTGAHGIRLSFARTRR
jgi:hypothetical protein